MKDGFIVVRKEKHLDDKYWVCEDKIDALRIASDVTDYWMDNTYYLTRTLKCRVMTIRYLGAQKRIVSA